jgi:hypothetical protein
MKRLLVYPRCPAAFGSFRYAMKFINRKAQFMKIAQVGFMP